MRLNQLIQFVAVTPSESQDDDFKGFYLIPDRTLPIHRYGKRERQNLSAPKNYPGIQATRIWNNTQRRRACVLRTKSLFEKMLVLSAPNVSLAFRAKLRMNLQKELNDLRPHPTILAIKYSFQGENQENIDLLLKNYELLPDIKISEGQFKFLNEVLAGNTDTNTIEKGFDI